MDEKVMGIFFRILFRVFSEMRWRSSYILPLSTGLIAPTRAHKLIRQYV